MDQNNIAAYVSDYDIAFGPSPWIMAEKVTALLKKGYMVYGQPFIDKDGTLCQAMVKLDDRYKQMIDKALDQIS